MSEIYRVWFRKAAAMEPGERIFLPVESHNEGRHIETVMKKEQAAFSKIDAVAASSVLITPNVNRDKQLWVVLRKMAYSPLVAYVKENDEARPYKVRLETDETRLQMISVKVMDGKTAAEIAEEMGGLSEDEKRYFGLEGDDEN